MRPVAAAIRRDGAVEAPHLGVVTAAIRAPVLAVSGGIRSRWRHVDPSLLPLPNAAGEHDGGAVPSR